jgi:putative ABC transport system permease protein
VTIREIAIKNLLRRKAKAGFILAGLIIGVATVVAVITFADTMTLDINHKLEKYGANILIVPRTDNLTLTYGGMAMGGVSFEMEPIREDQLAKIRHIKNAANIAAVGPMVLGGVRIQDRTALLAGVDMEAAAILKPWWKINGDSPDENGLLLGSEAARILGLSQGQTIFLNQRKMSIAGILSPTGSQDDDLVFTHLKTAQEILGKTGEVSLVEVAALCNACPIEEMVTQIAEQLPSSKVMAIQQVVKGRMETLSHFRKFSYGLSVVVVFIGGLVVLVTLMGSVKERTQEIGIFRAIGFRQSHIMRIIFLETGIISTSAGILGYLVGVGSIWAGLALFGHQVSPIPHLNPFIAIVSVVLALGVGLLAGLYPASMAARMDPNQALSSI